MLPAVAVIVGFLVMVALVYIIIVADVAAHASARATANIFGQLFQVLACMYTFMGTDDDDDDAVLRRLRADPASPTREPLMARAESPGDSDASSPWRMPSPGGENYVEVHASSKLFARQCYSPSSP